MMSAGFSCRSHVMSALRPCLALDGFGIVISTASAFAVNRFVWIRTISYAQRYIRSTYLSSHPSAVCTYVCYAKKVHIISGHYSYSYRLRFTAFAYIISHYLRFHRNSNRHSHYVTFVNHGKYKIKTSAKDNEILQQTYDGWWLTVKVQMVYKYKAAARTRRQADTQANFENIYSRRWWTIDCPCEDQTQWSRLHMSSIDMRTTTVQTSE